MFEHYQLRQIQAFIGEFHRPGEPLVAIGHSMGGNTLDDLAETGQVIDLVVFVDSAWPEIVPDHVERVLSVRAERGGRFHVRGGKVNARMVIPDTRHTTVDDAPALHDAVLQIMDQLVLPERKMQPFYIGAYLPLDEDDIRHVAVAHAIPEYLLRAVIEVEAAGRGQHSSGAVVARYEPHIAYRFAKGRTRDALVQADLAWLRWRRGEPKGSPYPLIDRCAAIAGEEIAALATSWGMGQVMGFNHGLLGYGNAVEMVKDFARGETVQLQGMISFIEAAGIKAALLRQDWARFAEIYNGPGHAAHDYAGRLAAAARKWRALLGEDTPMPIEPSPEPPKTAFGLEAYRNRLRAAFPALNAAQIDIILALASLLDRQSLADPPGGESLIEVRPGPEPEPALEAGFSLPASGPAAKGVLCMKNVFQSRTIWGIAAMVISQVLPKVLPALGYEFTSADAQALVTALETLLGAVGAILAIYGRVKADKPLALYR